MDTLCRPVSFHNLSLAVRSLFFFIIVLATACGSEVRLPDGGGGGGADSGCSDIGDCAVPQSVCTTAACIDGQCQFVNRPRGTVIADGDVVGDCAQPSCNGNGAIEPLIDDSDLPDDGNECSAGICDEGVASHVPTPGADCGMGLTCDAAGQCTGCNDDGDCGTDTACQRHMCLGNVCGVLNENAGTPLPAAQQVSGDCLLFVCDGTGSPSSEIDDLDLPEDMNECTVDSCMMGVAQNAPVTPGTPCTQGGGKLCDTAGTCIDCDNFAGLVTSDTNPLNPGPGIGSVWTYAGQVGIQAGDEMCAAIGADHVCSYSELVLADSLGELSAIPDNTEIWLHRLTAVGMFAPGPGGRCNDWTYPGGCLAEGEYVVKEMGQMQYHFDDDTVYSGMCDHFNPTAPLSCGLDLRAIACCWPSCL